MAQVVKVTLGVVLLVGTLGFLGWRLMEMRAAPPAEVEEDAPVGHLMQEQPGLTVRGDKEKTVVDPFGKVYGYEGKDGHLVDARGGRINRDGTKWVDPVEEGAHESKPGPMMPFALRMASSEVLKGHEQGVLDLAFSPDGKMLVSGGAEGELIVWDVAAGKEVRRVTTGMEHVMQVAFSPDGKRVSGVGLVHGWGVWDVATGEKVGEGDGSVTLGGAVFFPDGEHLAMGEKDGVAICDARTGEVVNEVPTGELVNSLCVSADGERLAVGCQETVSVVNKAGEVMGVTMRVRGEVGERMQIQDWSLARVRSVAFDGAGRVVFLDGEGPWRWEVGTGTVEGWSAPLTLQMAVVGDWVCQTGQGSVEVTNLTVENFSRLGVGGQCHSVAASPGGMLAVGLGGDFEGATYKATDRADIVVFGADEIAEENRAWREYGNELKARGGGPEGAIRTEIEQWE